MPVEITSEDRSFANINTSSSGYTTLVAAIAGRKILVWGWYVSVGGDTTVSIVDLIGASDRTVLDGPHACTLANALRGVAISDSRFGVFETREGAALQINNSAAVQISGNVRYRYV